MVTLTVTDLVIAAVLVGLLALLSLRLQTGISLQLLVAAARTAIRAPGLGNPHGRVHVAGCRARGDGAAGAAL